MRKNWLMMMIVALFVVACGEEESADDNRWEFCHAEPSCPDGTIEHSDSADCPEEDCEEVTECNTTIYCEHPVVCDGMPVCPAGTVQISDESECPDEGECFSESMCNFTIWCAELISCGEPFPACPPEANQVNSESECPADVSCYEVGGGCAGSTWCWEPEQPICEDDRSYFDQCPVDFCDGPPEDCDPCFNEGPYFEDDCGCGCEIREPHYCAVSDATGEGFCDMIVATVFDGDTCGQISGCSCVGEDCDRFESLEHCYRVTSDCDNQCGDPDEDICGNYLAPEYPGGPEDCPQGSTYTVVDCEPRCIERDSCELFDDAP